MVLLSRDTTVHVVAVLLGLAVLFLADSLGIRPEDGPESMAVFLTFYALVLGGAHFYLAVRGEDGLVPVDARWRYVAALAAFLGAAAAVAYAGDRTVATIRLETLGLGAMVATALVYVVAESIAGYRASRPA